MTNSHNSIQESAHLPEPLVSKYSNAYRAVHSLRPDYPQALSHLIDCAELFLQFGASISLCALSRQALTTSVELEAVADFLKTTFLKTSLSTGHFLQAWKLAAVPLAESTREIDQAYVPFAQFILTNTTSRAELLHSIDRIPEFRNRHKGHSFTIPDDRARTLYDEFAPALGQLLIAIAPLFQVARLTVVMDTADGLVELAQATGPVPLNRASPHVLNTTMPVRKHEVLLVSSLVGQFPETLEPNSALVLSPLVIETDGELYLYQGRRGKGSLFMSASAQQIVRKDLAPVMDDRFAPVLIPFSQTESTEEEPPWAADLREHELLTVKLARGGRPNPAGFYRGARASWADFASNLDIRRSAVVSTGEVLGYAGIQEQSLGWLRRAERFEQPVIVITGNAGSGKSTLLARLAIDITTQHHSEVCVLFRRFGASLDLNEYRLACSKSSCRVLCVVVDDAREIATDLHSVVANAAHERLPILFLCAERANLWTDIACETIHLTDLTRQEIIDLLDRLLKSNELHCLEDLDRENQIALFETAHERQLLVALRETTEGKRFDEIVLDEYQTIPSDKARSVYLTTCVYQTCGVFLPEPVAWQVAGTVTGGEFNRIIHKATRGILASRRSPVGRVYTARHSVVAEIIANTVARDESELFMHLEPAMIVTSSAFKDDRPVFISLLRTMLTSPWMDARLEAECDLDPLINALGNLRRWRSDLLDQMLALPEIGSGVLRLCSAIITDAASSPFPLKGRVTKLLISRLESTGAFDQALKLCEHLTGLGNPALFQSIEFCTTAIVTLGRADRPVQAVDVCRKAILARRNKDLLDFAVAINLSTACRRIGEYTESLAVWENCAQDLADCPKGPRTDDQAAREMQAIVSHYKDENLDEAAIVGERLKVIATRLSVARPNLYLALTDIYRAQGRLDRAIKTCIDGANFITTVEDHVDQALTLRHVQLCEDTGCIDEAIVLCHRAMEQFPVPSRSREAIVMRLAHLYEQVDRLEDALELVVVEFEKRRVDDDISEPLVLFLCSRYENDRALNLLKQTITERSQAGHPAVSLGLRLARLYEERGQIHEAISAAKDTHDRCWKSGKNPTQALLRVTKLLLSINETTEAMSLCQSDISNQPEKRFDGTPWILAAQIFLTDDKVDRALAVVKKGLDRLHSSEEKSNEIKFVIELARVFAAAERPSEAIDLLRPHLNDESGGVDRGILIEFLTLDLVQGNLNAVTEYMERSLVSARLHQGVKLAYLYGRLLRSRGESQKALDLILPIHDRGVEEGIIDPQLALVISKLLVDRERLGDAMRICEEVYRELRRQALRTSNLLTHAGRIAASLGVDAICDFVERHAEDEEGAGFIELGECLQFATDGKLAGPERAVCLANRYLAGSEGIAIATGAIKALRTGSESESAGGALLGPREVACLLERTSSSSETERRRFIFYWLDQLQDEVDPVEAVQKLLSEVSETDRADLLASLDSFGVSDP